MIPTSEDGAGLICIERNRQLTEEQWGDAHDDKYKANELPRAAACYAMGKQFKYFNGYLSGVHFENEPRLTQAWPWDEGWWKPKRDDSDEERIRELSKAGALIAAEIDRLLRRIESR